MRLVQVLALIASSLLYFSGCGEKQEVLQESQVPLSVEVLPTDNITLQTTEVGVPESKVLQEVNIPQGPYKPTNQEIQIALKNAGLYTGEIDGKIGPLSKKAIEEFQRQNNLQVDGKVGPKTWGVLSKYLNPQPQTTTRHQR